MKTLILAFIFSVAVFLPSSMALAEDLQNNPATTTQTTTEKTQSNATQAKEKLADIKARNEERKKRLKTKLDAATEKNIKGKCVSAQAKLKMVSAKVKETDEKYIPKYDEFIQKVEKLESALAGNGVKSSELLGQISEAKTKLAAVKTASQNLQSSVDDASALDCQVDPTSFKAAVDDAREQAKALTQAKQELSKFARTNLKTTLQSIKATN